MGQGSKNKKFLNSSYSTTPFPFLSNFFSSGFINLSCVGISNFTSIVQSQLSHKLPFLFTSNSSKTCFKRNSSCVPPVIWISLKRMILIASFTYSTFISGTILSSQLQWEEMNLANPSSLRMLRLKSLQKLTNSSFVMYPSGVRGTRPSNSFSIVYFDFWASLNYKNSFGLNCFALLTNLCTQL